MSMHREITLSKDTRCFQKTRDSNTLGFKGDWRKKGETLTVSPPEKLYYDHRLQEAVSFTFNQKTYYMLVQELDLTS